MSYEVATTLLSVVGVGLDSRSGQNGVQCHQQHATAATFYRDLTLCSRTASGRDGLEPRSLVTRFVLIRVYNKDCDRAD